MTPSPPVSFSPRRDPLAGASVVELRQYTLAPGRREELVDLFERELVETQEDAGMGVAGLYRDRDDPDRFVWWRGFSSMASRHAALSAFYGGPVWATHGPAANATMLDSDDVLLLRHTDPPRAPGPAVVRPPVRGTGATESDVSAEWHVGCVYTHRADDTLSAWLATDVHPLLVSALGTDVSMWRTEPEPNTFPALPVRSDTVVVWGASFPDGRAYSAARTRLEHDATWRDHVEPELARALTGRRYLRLQPTSRSRHPGRRATG
ncbi:MAG: putative quinol monooxygenase [Phycicoccus sp.]